MTYAQFRGSAVFPVLLALSVSGWMGICIGSAHGWITSEPFFDAPGVWGNLNTSLSIEASIATSLLLMDMARSDALLRKQLAKIDEQADLIARQMVVTQHMIEAQLALIERIGNVGRGGAADPVAGVGLGDGVR